MIGAGVGTQFDTWADQETLEGTPLVLFLSRPARIELLVDGRLVSSRSYAAGNNELDTSPLADGSYSVLCASTKRMVRSGKSGASSSRTRMWRRSATRSISLTRAFSPTPSRITRSAWAAPYIIKAASAWRLNNAIAVDIGALGT